MVGCSSFFVRLFFLFGIVVALCIHSSGFFFGLNLHVQYLKKCSLLGHGTVWTVYDFSYFIDRLGLA